jgi:hypothetical protein
MGVRYVRPGLGGMLLEPDEDQTCLAGRIYPMGIGYVRPDWAAMILESDWGIGHVWVVQYIR